MSEDYDDYEGLDYTDFRPARCNGCEYAKLKHSLGNNVLALHENGGTGVYELDAQPVAGQGSKVEHEGRPVRFKAWFMDIGHSDECYHWRPR